jgi:hypothetical protein
MSGGGGSEAVGLAFAKLDTQFPEQVLFVVESCHCGGFEFLEGF